MHYTGAAGPLRSIDTKTNDTNLPARATLGSRQLYKTTRMHDMTKGLFKSTTSHAGALMP